MKTTLTADHFAICRSMGNARSTASFPGDLKPWLAKLIICRAVRIVTSRPAWGTALLIQQKFAQIEAFRTESLARFAAETALRNPRTVGASESKCDRNGGNEQLWHIPCTT